MPFREDKLLERCWRCGLEATNDCWRCDRPICNEHFGEARCVDCETELEARIDEREKLGWKVRSLDQVPRDVIWWHVFRGLAGVAGMALGLLFAAAVQTSAVYASLSATTGGIIAFFGVQQIYLNLHGRERQRRQFMTERRRALIPHGASEREGD